MLWLGIVFVSFMSACFQRLEKLIGFISFLGLGYIAGTPNLLNDPDATVYMRNYNSGSDYFESGYNWIAKLAEPKMDYLTFRLYSSLIVFFLLFIGVRLLTRHVSSISFLYAIAIFPIDKIQVRNCMGAVFILFGAFLLLKFEKKGILPALAIIFVGSFFHSIALYFLLLPLLWLFKGMIRTYFSVITSGLMVLSFAFEILGSTILAPLLVELLDRFGNRTNVAENVSNIYSGGGQSIIEWMIFLAITVFMVVTVQLVRQFRNDAVDSDYQLVLCALVLWSAALILMTLSIDYIRILRIVAFFYFIYIINAVAFQRNGMHLKGLLIGLVSASILMFTGFWAYGFTGEKILSVLGFI